MPLTAQHEGYVFTPDVPIYWKSIGEGPALVLLHGGPGSNHRYFLPHVLDLARTHRLVFIDQRGCGRSGAASDPSLYTLDTMVADLDAVRSALELETFALLGHSFGGLLAQAYAIHDLMSRRKSALSHLVLVGTASSARAVDADFARIRKSLPARTRKAIEGHEKRGIFGPDGAYRPAYAKLCQAALAPYNYRQVPAAGVVDEGEIAWPVLREMWVRKSDFRIDGNLRGFDFTERLRTLRVPTLVIAGSRDLVSARSARATQDAIPGSQLVIVPDTGHMMFVEQPALFVSVVREFLGMARSR
jgi:proline iminopeptidase